MGLRSVGLPEILVIFVVFLLYFPAWIVAFWRIFSRAGYPGVVSLAMLVPVLNVIMILFLGFADWPVLRELNALRRRIPSGEMN